MVFSNVSPTIALLTDFGLRDGFVGVLKGVLRSIAAPSVRSSCSYVDVTHEIERQDIRQGAWVLESAYPYFPENTIFVCVVDPGVGSATQQKLLVHRPDLGQFFIAPDNGLLTPVLRPSQSDEDASPRVCLIENRDYFWKRGQNVSQTFHGRDAYAPVAAHLANAIVAGTVEDFLTSVGSNADHFTLLESSPALRGEGGASGRVEYVDIYGNLITNIPSAWLPEPGDDVPLRMRLENLEWEGRWLASYSQGKDMGENVFAVPGSGGFVELSVYQKSARNVLNASAGHSIQLQWMR